MDEKLMKKLGIIIGAFVGFIFLLFIFSSCSNSSYTYEKLESKMMSVAENYFKNNEKELPTQDKDTKSYTLKKMISDGKIDELSELFNDENIKCDGNVTVTNNNGYYLYSPYLSCGKDYETKYLKDKIIEDNLVEAGVGLYELNDSYVFKGETKNNFLSFAGANYRIMRINEDGTIRVIKIDGEKNAVWDNRYNETTGKTYGVNDYVVNNTLDSRLKETTEEFYNGETFSDTAKSYITTQTLCVGKRTAADVTKDGSTECASKLENQAFGSVAIYEILQASLDANCSSTQDIACKNYNWFTGSKIRTWTITANAEKPDYAFSYANGTISSNVCKTKNKLNVVFNLTDKIVYTAGTGTEEDPYVALAGEE